MVDLRVIFTVTAGCNGRYRPDLAAFTVAAGNNTHCEFKLVSWQAVGFDRSRSSNWSSIVLIDTSGR